MRLVSEVTGISASWLHEIKRKGLGGRWAEEQALRTAVVASHARSKQRYGYRRVQRDLRGLGITASPRRVRKLMLIEGIRGKKGPKWKKPNVGLPAVLPQDLIQRNFSIPTPRTVVFRDLKTIATAQGYVYADFLEDGCTREILAWDVLPNKTKELSVRTLKMLLKQLPSGFDIHHTDRGSEFVNDETQQLLSDHGIRQSCALGGGISNGMVESFNGTLEVELLRGRRFKDLPAVHRAIGGFIPWYNRVRLHSSLGYRTPAQAAEDYRCQP